jgi:hypothetical protein
MICSPEIRSKAALIRSPGRRPSPGEGPFWGAIQRPEAHTDGIAAHGATGQKERAELSQAAAGRTVIADDHALQRSAAALLRAATSHAGAVVADEDSVDRDRAAVAPHAAAAIGPPASDRHLRQVVVTLIDAKLAEPPF